VPTTHNQHNEPYLFMQFYVSSVSSVPSVLDEKRPFSSEKRVKRVSVHPIQNKNPTLHLSVMNKKRYRNEPLPIDSDDEPSVVSGTEQAFEVIEPSQLPVKRKSPPTEQIEPYQWKEGQSGNPSGRPPDMIKGIALRVAQLKAGKVLSEREQEKLKRLGIDAADITTLESILIDWATSKNPLKQSLFVERVGGKVPNINLNAQIQESLVSRFKSKLTDSELERIAGGEDAMDILLDKLPDVDGSDGDGIIEGNAR